MKPITVLGTAPNVLDVRPDFPARTVQALVDYAKANPGKVSFASQGNGSTSHLTAILFEKLTGTKMVHIPYRGTSPALQDIMGNTVDLFFDSPESFARYHDHPAIGREAIAALYGVDPAHVKRFAVASLNVVKLSYPRIEPQGGVLERDMHSGQQFVRLLDVELS